MEADKQTNQEEYVAEISNVRKSFGQLRVLQNVSFKFRKGENLVVIGKSGSGKSVLIKCMVRLIEADAGTVTVLNRDIADLGEEELNDLRLRIGFLFQGAALYDSMSVRENLEFPLRVKRIKSTSEVSQRVEEALKNVGLSESIDKTPSELSGGMRKRLGLARSLMLKPEIVLYDEPTTGLDPLTSKGISELILDVQKKYNTSSLIITHDMACAKIVANRILVLKDGAFVAEGTYEELEKSEDEWIRSFFA